jgi:hypothetical protein
MDWLATFFSLAGIVLNAKKLIWCWPAWCISTVFWASYAIHSKQWSLLVLQVGFFVSNLWGWRQWWKDDQTTLVGEAEIRYKQRKNDSNI